MSANKGQEFDSNELPAEDYKQRRRIKEIRDSIQHVFEQRRRADDFLHTGQISRRTAQRMHRMAVQELIKQSKYTIENSDKTVEIQFGEDEDSIQEWSCYEYFWNQAELGYLELPKNYDPYPFRGLKSIIEFDDPLVLTVESVEHNHVEGRTVSNSKIEFQVPMQVSEQAFMELLDFWGMHDLDITIDDGVPAWSYNIVPDQPPEEAEAPYED